MPESLRESEVLQPTNDARLPVCRFGAFELDRAQQELRKDGVPVHLQPQPFKVLDFLVSNAGQTVTREDLEKVVWDIKSGLTRCIKQIRDVLDDDVDEPRFIETRPRLGYRFIAQVQPVDPVPARPDPEPAPSPASRVVWYVKLWQRWPAVLLAGLALVAILGLGLLVHFGPPPHQPPLVRPAVAVLGFKNAAGKPETNWLSTALSEMLTTELAAGEKLRTISGEDVSRTKIDLALRDEDSYAADTLARIRKNLGADYVVLGSYLDLGPATGGQVRLDLRLQDVRAGSTLAAVSETGNEAGLPDLVVRAGKELRERLGAGELTPEQENNTRSSVPSNPEAAILYSDGLTKLRSFDALGARDLLQQSIQIEPDFPLTHAALSEVWRILGDLDKTKEESRRAFETSKGLSREDRRFIEGRYREAWLQWEQATQAYKALFDLAQDDVEYGLALARAQSRSGKPVEAFATLEQLKRLPAPAGDDPQIDLEESIAATEARNSQRAVDAGVRAAQKARETGSKLLLTRALRAQSEALLNLGEMDKAQEAAAESEQAARAVGDDDSAAYALFLRGKLLLQREDLSGARSALDQAQQIWRKNGDQTYAALSSMLLGIVSEAEGNLPEAQKACEGALAVSRDLGDRATYARVLLFLGGVLAVEGNLSPAHQKYSQAATMIEQMGRKVDEERSDLALAQLSIAEGHPQETEATARRVLEDPHVLDAPDFKLAAKTVLAESLLAQGRTAEAQEAVPADGASREVPALAAGINPGLGEDLSIFDERLRASTGKPNDVTEATRGLQAILDESAKHGNLMRQFQARLALGEIEMKWGDKAAGRVQLATLEQKAHARGFGLIASQAGALRN
jgi:DNA-binding winged helix-turn-helix (wHTH) protein/tetratricopeptide (TPR) repeat protein